VRGVKRKKIQLDEKKQRKVGEGGVSRVERVGGLRGDEGKRRVGGEWMEFGIGDRETGRRKGRRKR